MASLEEMEAHRPEERPKKVPFLQLRADFIRKWGGSNSSIGAELDELLRRYLQEMAA